MNKTRIYFPKQPLVITILLMFFCSCQKFDGSLPIEDNSLQSVAKKWYTEQRSQNSKDSDLDLSKLTIDWSHGGFFFNALGDSVFTVPMGTDAMDNNYYYELNVVRNEIGEILGAVKEYQGDPFGSEKLILTFYSGAGDILQVALHDPLEGTMQYVTPAPHRNKTSTSGGNKASKRPTENIIETVHVTGYIGTSRHGEDAFDNPSRHELQIPSSGGGGGSNTGFWSQGTITIQTVDIMRQIKNKPFALLPPDIPCATIRKWLATAKHQVQQAQINKLNSIVGKSGFGVGGYMIKTEQVARVQDINNAYSTVVNMDYFPVTVNQLPIVNGKRLTAPQFMEYIRKNINSFVDTDLSRFTPYNAYGVNDHNLWNSSNPLNAVIGIKIAPYMGVYDNGSVIVSKYSSTGWTFTTIHDPLYGNHPVSGNRDFGYVQNANGSYTFYTRGVDRLTNISGDGLQRLNQYPFNSADQLWRSFQLKIVDYVRQHGGTALWETLSKTEEIHRPNWQLVKDVMDGKKPLSTLSKDCDD